jgi:hypothetical protein
MVYSFPFLGILSARYLLFQKVENYQGLLEDAHLSRQIVARSQCPGFCSLSHVSIPYFSPGPARCLARSAPAKSSNIAADFQR